MIVYGALFALVRADFLWRPQSSIPEFLLMALLILTFAGWIAVTGLLALEHLLTKGAPSKLIQNRIMARKRRHHTS